MYWAHEEAKAWHDTVIVHTFYILGIYSWRKYLLENRTSKLFWF